MTCVALGDVCMITTGGTPARTRQDFFGGGIPWVKIGDMADGVVRSTDETISQAGLDGSSAKIFKRGTVLISIFATIGRTAILEIDATTNQAIAGITPNDSLDSNYLRYFLDSKHGELNALARGVAQPNINQKILKALQIPLPPLPEQRRIVDLLSRAEGIVRLRREAQRKAAELVPALFLDMFGDPASNPKGWPVKKLDEVSQVIAGIAKGRKLDESESVELPYMSVANVKDGYLDLSKVRTITIKRSEIEKLVIQSGDILMTEGGDPDKLGRGALWRGEIDGCVHQNHIFKVRSDRSRIVPEYLHALVGSPYGKGYFLRVAKKTTGIASISKTQLSAFPVVIPPIELQCHFAAKADAVRGIVAQQNDALSKAQAAFSALLHQMFQY